jgi:hypothetical protein
MPVARPIPANVVDSQRHATTLHVPLPIGALAPCNVSFTVRHFRADGSHVDEADGSITLTPAEFGALPSFAAFYEELKVAVHAKRATYDPAP